VVFLGRYFYFEVNGQPIFAKGSNFIPTHAMPELGTNPQVTEHLLRSSAEANHNMLRVWGGGVYETDFFYQVIFVSYHKIVLIFVVSCSCAMN